MLIPAHWLGAFSLDTILRPVSTRFHYDFCSHEADFKHYLVSLWITWNKQYYDHAGKKQDPSKVSKPNLMVMVQGNTIIDPSLNGNTERNGRTFVKAQTWPSWHSLFYGISNSCSTCKLKYLLQKTFCRLGLASLEFTILLVTFDSSEKTWPSFFGRIMWRFCREKW